MAKKRGTFAWSPLRDLMKKAGAEIVSRDAVELLLFYLEDKAKKMTVNSLKLAKHAKRKKITADDVKLSMDM